jgi:predicted oxidoreductase
VRGLVTETHVDGIILSSPVTDCDPVLRALEAMNIPFVRISPGTNHALTSSVFMDDAQAADDMTTHLINFGHRRIGFIKGHPNHMASDERLFGYRRALEPGRDQPYDTDLVCDGEFDFDSGVRAAASLLDWTTSRPRSLPRTTIWRPACWRWRMIAGSDLPDQLSVAGFDDTTLARTVWPPLTTIHQPMAELARTATEILIAGGDITHRRLPHHSRRARLGRAASQETNMSVFPLPPATRTWVPAAFPCPPIAWGMWRLAEGGRTAPMQRSWSMPRWMPGSTCSTRPISMASTAAGGFGDAEALLGEVLAQNPALRGRMVLASKGGIMPPLPYDQSAAYLNAAHRGLADKRLKTDVHRPLADPPPRHFAHPQEVARVLDDAVAAGKIRTLGVSNFTIHQIAALNHFLGHKLVSTQPEISPLRIDCFENGELDQAMMLGLTWRSAEVGVGGGHVVQALVVALVVIVLNEGFDLGLEVAGQEVVFQQDAVFQGLVPALDLALGLRMHRGAAHVAHLPGLDVFCEFARDVTGTVVAE